MEIVIDGWDVGARFACCHIIPHHPKCGRLHGHTYAASARFRGEAAGPMDLMLDFGEVKRAMREVCEVLDHHVLIPAGHPDISVKEVGPSYELRIVDKGYSLPKEDVLLLPVTACTAERLSEYFLEELLRRLKVGANVVVRGLRAVSDFEYELQMALMNRRLSSQVETVFMMPSEEYSYTSSTVIKEVAAFGGNVEGLVPKSVLLRLNRLFPK